MKKLLYILGFLIVSFAAKSQNKWDANKKNIGSTQEKAYAQGGLQTDSTLNPPLRDTNYHPLRAGAFVYQPGSNKFWSWNGVRWVAFIDTITGGPQVNSDWTATTGVSAILNKPTFATVAFTGNYNDLSNKPSIPAAQINSDWNANSTLAQILNRPRMVDSLYKPTTDSLAVVVREADNTFRTYRLGVGSSSGAGTVIQINQGYGIALTPSPITSVGLVAADTTKIIPYTDTLKNGGIATQTMLIKYLGSVSNIDFIIGDNAGNTPAAGTTVYTNAILQHTVVIGLFHEGQKIPLQETRGTIYAIADTTAGTITLHNGLFADSAYWSVIYRSPGGSGGVSGGLSSPTTANNGLNMSTATNVQLGGPLIQNTLINATGFTYHLDSATQIWHSTKNGTTRGFSYVSPTDILQEVENNVSGTGFTAATVALHTDATNSYFQFISNVGTTSIYSPSITGNSSDSSIKQGAGRQYFLLDSAFTNGGIYIKQLVSTGGIGLKYDASGTRNALLIDGTSGKLYYGPLSPITLTHTGSSGAATLVGNVLNIPVYGGGGSLTSGSGTTAAGTAVNLGGTLTSTASITASTFATIFNGTNTTSVLQVNNTSGNGNALTLSNVGNGYTIFAINNGGSGGTALFQSGSASTNPTVNISTSGTNDALDVTGPITAIVSGSGPSTGTAQILMSQYQTGLYFQSNSSGTPTSSISVSDLSVNVGSQNNVPVTISGSNFIFGVNFAMQSFANNAAAITGGLPTGAIYRNGDVLQIVH